MRSSTVNNDFSGMITDDSEIVHVVADAHGNLIEPDVPLTESSLLVLHQVTPHDLGRVITKWRFNANKRWLGGNRGFLTLLRNTLELDCQESGAIHKYLRKIASSFPSNMRRSLATERILHLLGLFVTLAQTNQLDLADEHAAMAVELYIHLCIALS